MITIFCALYCEAEALIRHYELKKDNSNVHFQVFEDEEQELRVAITGVGGIAAATAVGSICSRYGAGKNDMLLNFGTCAGMDEHAEGIYVCNKLTEAATGRTFYPDLLYRHGFSEAALITGDTCLQDGAQVGEILNSFPAILYDMEAAAIYQAGIHFVGPHRMQFIKLVSDHGVRQPQQFKSRQITPEQISGLVEQNSSLLAAHIDRLRQMMQEENDDRAELSGNGQEWLERLSADMHCSKVMQDELRQQLRYQELTGGSAEAVIRGMYGEGLLPCKDKREGKKCFEKLKQRLL